jgi:hypothetical protein
MTKHSSDGMLVEVSKPKRQGVSVNMVLSQIERTEADAKRTATLSEGKVVAFLTDNDRTFLNDLYARAAAMKGWTVYFTDQSWERLLTLVFRR